MREIRVSCRQLPRTKSLFHNITYFIICYKLKSKLLYHKNFSKYWYLSLILLFNQRAASCTSSESCPIRPTPSPCCRTTPSARICVNQSHVLLSVGICNTTYTTVVSLYSLVKIFFLIDTITDVYIFFCLICFVLFYFIFSIFCSHRQLLFVPHILRCYIQYTHCL